MAGADGDLQKLPDLLGLITKKYVSIETSEEASSSENYQNAIGDGVQLCSIAVQRVNELSLFSENEELDELSSESLKYMSLPAFHGYFISRKLSGDRKENLTSAKDHFKNFLKLCTDYSIRESSEDTKSLDPGKQRTLKVNRLKARKSLESRISELQTYVESEHVDEEVKREYYLSQVKRWIITAEEELDSIDRELPILEMMANGRPPRKDAELPQAPFESFILTRTKAQAKVFGAGYPSLPTYTVEEFYEMQAANGRLPSGPVQGGATASSEDPARVEEEEQEEKDDPDYLQKKRAWDEFKDENRRGSGNRYNRG